jgi:hypothetical protein
MKFVKKIILSILAVGKVTRRELSPGVIEMLL